MCIRNTAAAAASPRTCCSLAAAEVGAGAAIAIPSCGAGAITMDTVPSGFCTMCWAAFCTSQQQLLQPQPQQTHTHHAHHAHHARHARHAPEAAAAAGQR